MHRSVGRTIAIVAVSAAVVGCVEAPVASATSKICPTITGHPWHSSINTSSGNKYTSEAVGNVSCAEAATWIKKLSADKVRKGATKLNNGPTGFHCAVEVPDKRGYAEAGLCYTGTPAFPKNGFSWGV